MGPLHEHFESTTKIQRKSPQKAPQGAQRAPLQENRFSAIVATRLDFQPKSKTLEFASLCGYFGTKTTYIRRNSRVSAHAKHGCDANRCAAQSQPLHHSGSGMSHRATLSASDAGFSGCPVSNARGLLPLLELGKCAGQMQAISQAHTETYDHLSNLSA